MNIQKLDASTSTFQTQRKLSLPRAILDFNRYATNWAVYQGTKVAIRKWSGNLQQKVRPEPVQKLQGCLTYFVKIWLTEPKSREFLQKKLSLTEAQYEEMEEELIPIFSCSLADALGRLAGSGSEKPFADGLSAVLDLVKANESVLSSEYHSADPVWRTASLGENILAKAFPDRIKDLAIPYGFQSVAWNVVQAFFVPDRLTVNVPGSLNLMPKTSFFDILAKGGIVEDPELEAAVAAKKGGKFALFVAKHLADQAVQHYEHLEKDEVKAKLSEWLHWDEMTDNVYALLQRSQTIPWLLKKMSYHFILQALLESSAKGGTESALHYLLTNPKLKKYLKNSLEESSKKDSEQKKALKGELKALFLSFDWQQKKLWKVMESELRNYVGNDAKEFTEELRGLAEVLLPVKEKNYSRTIEALDLEGLSPIRKKRGRDLVSLDFKHVPAAPLFDPLYLELLADRGSDVLLSFIQGKKRNEKEIDPKLLKSGLKIGSVALRSMKTQEIEGIARHFLESDTGWKKRTEERWNLIDEILFDPSSLLQKNILEIRQVKGNWKEKLYEFSGEKEARLAFRAAVLHTGRRCQNALPHPFRFSFVPEVFEGLFLKVLENLLVKPEDPQVPKLPENEHPKKWLPINLFSCLLDAWNQHYLRKKDRGTLPHENPFGPLIEKSLELFGKDFLVELPLPKEVLGPAEKFSKELLPSVVKKFHKKWLEWQKDLPERPEDYLSEFFKTGRGYAVIEALSRYGGDYLHYRGKLSSVDIAKKLLFSLKTEFQKDPVNNRDLLVWLEKNEATLASFISSNIEVFCTLDNGNVNAFWKEIETQIGAAFYTFMKGLTMNYAEMQEKEPRLFEHLTKDLMNLFTDHVSGFKDGDDLYAALAKDIGKEGLSKEDLKAEFHAQVSQRIFKLAGVGDAPDALLPIWKIVQEKLAPVVVESTISKMLKGRDSLAYRLLESLDGEEPTDEVPKNPEEPLALPALPAFPEFDQAIGSCLGQLSEILPDIFKRFLFNRIEISRQKEIGNKIRHILGKADWRDLADKGLEKWLEAFHPGKWNPERRNGMRVELYQPDGGYHFDFEKAGNALPPIDKNELRERIVSRMEAGIKRATSKAKDTYWKNFQIRLDAVIQRYLGTRALGVKAMLDPWFRYIFISGLGKLISLILWPLKEALLWALRMGLRAKVYQIHRAMDHEAHEVLLYRALHRVLLTFEKLNDGKKQKVQNRGARLPYQPV